MKIYTFHSPKSAGNTLLCLNIGLLLKRQNPDQKIAVLQLNQYPDMHLYNATSVPQQTIAALIPFHNTKEWKSSLISKIIQKKYVDFIPSPTSHEWTLFTDGFWKSFRTLCKTRYNILLIDLGQNIGTDHIKNWCDASDKIICPLYPDPVQIELMNDFQKSLPRKKTITILNQASPKDIKRFPQAIGTLPLNAQHIWSQCYQQFPMILRPKSKWSKSLHTVVKALNLTT